MKHALLVGLGISVALWGCGEPSPATGGDLKDASMGNPPGQDAGSIEDPPDAGPGEENDAGPGEERDAGRDAGTPGKDAGTPGKDAGTADAGRPPLPKCPTFDPRVKVGALQSAEMKETSGIVVSRRNPGVLWAHNDSGDSPRVFAITPAGKLLGTYDIGGGAQAHDWEDLAITQLNGTWYLVIGDIGGNNGRHALQLYFVEEPAVSATQAPVTVQLAPARTLQVTYPGVAEEHNAESLFVDPVTQELIIVTKNTTTGISPVFRKSPPHVDGSNTPLESILTLNFNQAPLGGIATTAADISNDGREIIIKTYQTTYLWRRMPGASIEEALDTPPCPLPQAPGEAIAFTPDGQALYSIAEGVGADVFHYDRN